MIEKNVFPQVEDDFFKAGNIGLKIREIILAVIGWIIFLLPFMWLLITLYTPFNWQDLHFFQFKTEIDTFHILSWFLGVSFVLILLHHVIMSIRVNHFVDSMSNDKDSETKYRIEIRNKRFDDIFEERFGNKDFRHNVKFFNVDSDKNFDKNYLFNNLRSEGKTK
ncbi:MAG: hypothetical protein SOI57_00105 [Leuconostoc gelidum]|jgi:hypothetical protein|uniref:hypothetical protein n=1 Tax=Leuconostoc gelidum TaxID=1244 RepID=UPI0002193CE9|nr:hypothetical protein [Leuconostoc gelidum]AFS40440.1 hypothetical protein C269_05005 [Leuconostoc gelidum JB7]MBZ5978380.1 hypothetical protein [Leuconostoc gelidum subsp. gelidum]MBZ5992699.1 hypothetical protein [Leuconostoc gelidum subsp. gelidum]USP16383.1 hypothetical protein J4766_05050 [Leuconostoc gelidum subsp. aenigmaticum]GMA68204.1 hypothetical protein GCM10025884_18310 [Leuconostoc gelidum subsp. gelidum]